MSFQLFMILFLIFHVIYCIAVYLLLRMGLLRFSLQIMPIIAFVPVVGTVIGIFAEYNTRRNKTGSREETLESLHVRDNDYRLISLQADDASDSILPLEEAIIINDQDTRRKIMMDILHENPGEYIDLLQKARLNDDIEVTHYASTAIMEIQREFELSLQMNEKKLQDSPESEEALNSCAMAYEKYISSGLINDNIVIIHRRRYAEILETLLKINPKCGSYLMAASNNYCEMGNIAEAKKYAESYVSYNPSDESGWLQMIKIYAKAENPAGIRYILSEIKRRGIYLSPQGINIASFWSKEELS